MTRTAMTTRFAIVLAFVGCARPDTVQRLPDGSAANRDARDAGAPFGSGGTITVARFDALGDPPQRLDAAQALDTGDGTAGVGGTGGFTNQGAFFLPGLSESAVSAARTPPPISGGTLAIVSHGKIAVVADPDRDVVNVVDLADQTKRTLALQTGDEPGRVIEDSDGRVHVVLRRGNAVVTLDPITATIVSRRSVCANPRGIAYVAGLQQIVVACVDGHLVSLPAAGDPVVRDVYLDLDLRDVVADGDDLMVSRFRSAEVLYVDSSGHEIKRVSPYALASGLNAVITRSAAVAWRLVQLPGVGAIALHELSADEVSNSHFSGAYGGLGLGSVFRVGATCGGLVSGGLTEISGGGDAVVRGTMGLVTAGVVIDFAISLDAKTIAVAILPGGGPVPGPVLVGVLPVGNLLNGDPCAILRELNNSVVVAPAPVAPLLPAVDAGVDAEETQQTPDAAASSAVLALDSATQIISLAYDPSGQLWAQTREPATLRELNGHRVLSLSTVSVEDTGHRLFHTATSAGLACMSCHPEGGDDGRMWLFGQPDPHRTQNLRGGILSTAPFHWDGMMTNVDTIMASVYTGLMSGPQLQAQHTQTMSRFLNAIPALAPTSVADADAISAGNAVFQSAGCGTCHSGAKFTNNQTVDVGTGGAFQVPSLLGVAYRAPYLHSGCAKTLADRFNPACGGGDHHGVTSMLTASQLANLIAYLSSL